ncbi:MAG: chromosome partitioning protein ParB [Rhodobacteraceae bacterium]|nr:chromosome partitioning protein ParB [Paracoccaceae bacterium]MBB97906.1 chromosome partitioning protein ParB [Paracoccaceae bacterium]
MSRKKHDAIFDDVLSGLDAPEERGEGRAEPAGRARFLRRSTALGERVAGEREEKVLHWIDPERCRMWARHNREYSLLTEDNCRDLIDGIRAQGRQEFPAVVRRLSGEDHDYEVICGARRHFAVSWLRANNYPQFRYLVEVRDMTDEEAFRLADIENRDRLDISDYERARDYAEAIELYYGGRQKTMAARLEVSESWLSRYLALARLPDEIIGAFSSMHDIRELHARVLKPLLADEATRETVLEAARAIAADQQARRQSGGAGVAAPDVVSLLKAAAAPPKPAVESMSGEAGSEGQGGEVAVRRKGAKLVIEVPKGVSRDEAEAVIGAALDDYFQDG